MYFALAERNARGAAVALSERAALFDLAFTKAGGGGGGANHVNGVSVASNSVESSDQTADAAFVETLDGKIKVLGFQQRVRIVFPKSQHCLPIQD